jgi:hypothetical protein
MNEGKRYRDFMRHIDKIGRNHISNIAPADEIIELAFSECRIQGHSSGRAGGISHQWLN